MNRTTRPRGGTEGGGSTPRRLLLALPALLLVLLPAAAAGADLDSLSVEEATRSLARHLAALDGREFDVHAEPLPLLRKTLLGHGHLKYSPFAGPRYLVHANGKVEPYSLEGYVASLRDEGVGAPAKAGEGERPPPRAVAEAILSVDQPEGVLLEGLSDIPGYCRLPLEWDFKGVVRPPWFYEDHGTAYWFFYTWQRDGGVVTRYRFTFRGPELVPPVLVLRIGEGVGDHRPAGASTVRETLHPAGP